MHRKRGVHQEISHHHHERSALLVNRCRCQHSSGREPRGAALESIRGIIFGGTSLERDASPCRPPCCWPRLPIPSADEHRVPPSLFISPSSATIPSLSLVSLPSYPNGNLVQFLASYGSLLPILSRVSLMKGLCSALPLVSSPNPPRLALQFEIRKCLRVVGPSPPAPSPIMTSQTIPRRQQSFPRCGRSAHPPKGFWIICRQKTRPPPSSLPCPVHGE